MLLGPVGILVTTDFATGNLHFNESALPSQIKNVQKALVTLIESVRGTNSSYALTNTTAMGLVFDFVLRGARLLPLDGPFWQMLDSVVMEVPRSYNGLNDRYPINRLSLDGVAVSII